MGVVYLANDTRLDRQVAIKALPEHLANDPDRLVRFEREARSLASLNHPNVAGIYGVEEQDGRKYLVLEYVEGETLAERLDRGPMPIDEALEVYCQIAAGVEAAHEAGVFHRDFKPANVKITPEGKVKVLDFGLAKVAVGGSSSSSYQKDVREGSHEPGTPEDAAATIILFAGVIIGHAVARRSKGARWLDALAVLAFVTPASVLGVGIIAVWNRCATRFVYGTLAILVIGFVARYAVVGVRVFASVVAQMPVNLETAAAAAGAGFCRRLVRIVLPLGARGAAIAWLLAVVFCLRDLDTAVLFYPPGREPLTVRIFTLEANGPEAVVAALGVFHVVLTATVLGVAILLFRRKASA